jgi:RimJ/RimL family protein N-acetyltransferase
MTILTTDRLILSPVAVADFDDLCALWGDEAFTRHIMGHALTREDVWFRLLRDLGHWQAMGYGNWAVRLRDGGDYVGSVGVLDYRRELVPPFDAPELGWGVAPRFQGQGLAGEALGAALAWVDDELNAARTVCMISADNTASMTLAGRVGYRPYAEGAYKGSTVQLLDRRAT